MIEERDEETPRGGVRTVTVYLSADGNETTREEASHALVSEYDAEDRWLGESVLVLEPEPVAKTDVRELLAS